MSENTQEKSSLTEAQNDILAKVYDYRDWAEITSEDTELLKVMFDKPEKLIVLRKVLSIFSQKERGLFIQGTDDYIEGGSAEEYRLNHKIEVGIESSIKSSLGGLYTLLQGKFVAERKDQLEAANERAKKEADVSEELKENKDMHIRGVGTNI